MYPKLAQPSRNCRFDGFEVDTQTGTLSHQGERIPIQELPFQLLAVLLRHPGELVSREDLRDELWPPGVHVDYEVSLATAVKKLRQALGDTAKEPRFIETHPGRGYRFLRPVEQAGDLAPLAFHPADEADPRPSDGPSHIIPFRGGPSQESRQVTAGSRRRPLLRWVATGLVLVTAGAALVLNKPWRGRVPTTAQGATPSVLALPTKVLGSADSAFLGDAIPDTLSTLLAGVEGLDTKVPPSSAQVDRVQGDVASIGKAYQADFLILTTVTTEQDRLRLNVRLAEASTQKIRWASQYEATRSNYTGLVHDAAQALVRALKPGAAGPSEIRPKESSEVELALQEGRYFTGRYWVQGQSKDYDRARKSFDRALQLSPTSARVLGAVAVSYWEKSNRDGDAQAVKDAETWARRAIARDPRSGAWAILAAAEIAKPRANLENAVEWGVKAIRYAPRDPGSHGAFGSVAPGVTFMAVCGMHARELDPLGNAEAGMTASGLIWLGRAAEALPILDKALAENPEDPFMLAARAYALVRLGRVQEAAALLDRCRPKPSSKVNFVEDFWNQVHFVCVAAQGNAETTKALASGLVDRYLDPRTDVANLLNGTITMSPDLMRLGMREVMLKLLERSVETGYAPMLDWLARAPELQPLRRDPRFAKVLKTSRDQAAILAKHLDQAKASGELPRYLEQPLTELKVLVAQPILAP